MQPIKAVFFDLYETLITERNIHKLGATIVAARLGIAATAFEVEWRRHKEQRLCGFYSNYIDALRAVCREIDQPVDESALQQLYMEWKANKAVPFAQIDITIVQLLQQIRQIGIRIGLISNCMPEEAAAWLNCSLAPLFDAAVFSCQIGCTKPTPYIYHRACQLLHVTPEQSIFVGNGSDNELFGAIQVGMVAYQATWFLAQDSSEKAMLDVAAPYRRLNQPADVAAIIAAYHHRA
jgi:HAD superfamily hydrolase (TIGR01509 family)